MALLNAFRKDLSFTLDLKHSPFQAINLIFFESKIKS